MRERIAVVALVAIGSFCCSYQVKPLPPTLYGCLAACPSAVAGIMAKTPDNVEMCRCWAPNAFGYTFALPKSDAELAYAKKRWNDGLAAVKVCQDKGLGWGPDESNDNILCLKNDGTTVTRVPLETF